MGDSDVEGETQVFFLIRHPGSMWHRVGFTHTKSLLRSQARMASGIWICMAHGRSQCPSIHGEALGFLHKPHSGLWCDLVSRSRCVLCMDNKCMPSFVVSHSYINMVPIKMN